MSTVRDLLNLSAGAHLSFPRALSATGRRLRNAALALFAPTRLSVYHHPRHDHHRLSFAQEGEDLIIARIFEGRPPGIFVDVGAHHPQRFSNTYRLYLDGWTGLNFDATPGSMAAFDRLRPLDRNVETGVSEDARPLTLYCFNEPALNTFDGELARSRDGVRGYRIVERRGVPTERLDALLARHLAPGRRIDFLNVDVEGWEESVLKSNDWTRFRPDVVAVEDFGLVAVNSVLDTPAARLLQALDYALVARTANTSIFLARGAASGL